MAIDEHDLRQLQHALELAHSAIGRSDPNPRVGCVLADSAGLGSERPMALWANSSACCSWRRSCSSIAISTCSLRRAQWGVGWCCSVLVLIRSPVSGLAATSVGQCLRAEMTTKFWLVRLPLTLE